MSKVIRISNEIYTEIKASGKTANEFFTKLIVERDVAKTMRKIIREELQSVSGI